MHAHLIPMTFAGALHFRLALVVIVTSLLIAAFGCAYKSKPSAAPGADQAKETQTGLASFYSRAFQGEETASGETFDNREMVAAHPSYPLGTVVRVTNLEQDRRVELRIHDRGPSEENRAEGVIIDLSRAAAERIGMVKDGRCRVRVEVLEWGRDERK